MDSMNSNSYGSSPQEPKKKGGFSPALLGALVGGLITAAVILGVLWFTGNLGSKTATVSSGGSTISYTAGDVESAVQAVAQVVPKSVVGVLVESTESTSGGFGQSQAYSVSGSGFFVTNNGYIATNQHVVTSSPTKITISLEDGTEHDAKLIWSDADLDLAVLKIDVTGVQPLSMGDSDNLTVGQSVVAVGNPLGLTYSRSVTSGIISALSRSLVVDNQLIAEGLIQTDAAINSGNSGGPLVNMNGEVIGVNTYKQSQGEGMGFAIPINLFKPIIESVVKTGSFTPVTIGISGYDAEQAKYYGSTDDFTTGIYIKSVQSGTPAAQAGLQQGDIITKVDDKDITSMIGLRSILYAKSSGDKATITYTRGGQEKTAELTL